jgi:hypothetical protein
MECDAESRSNDKVFDSELKAKDRVLFLIEKERTRLKQAIVDATNHYHHNDLEHHMKIYNEALKKLDNGDHPYTYKEYEVE